MSDVAQEVVNAAETLAPNAPALEVAEAAVSTITNPSPENIVADIELAAKLIGQLKTLLSNGHPSLKALLESFL
jgi:hypothetical protein